MKKMNKKGFTIVELSIVIAVIAILSAVLIPTFSGIVTKSQESTRLQLATNAYHVALGATDAEGDPIILVNDKTPDAYILVKQEDKDYWFSLENGKIEKMNAAPELTDYTERTEKEIGEELPDTTFYTASTFAKE